MSSYFVLILIVFAGCVGNARKAEVENSAQNDVLLFGGTGVSKNDISAIAAILENNHITYSTADSPDLNAMTLAEIQSYRLLIVPGGDFMTMGKSLTAQTAANIRQAIAHGVNYFGVCAGAFLAGKSAYYNGFNLTSGATFGFYAAENEGVRKAAIKIVNADGTTFDQYWEDGPELSGWGQVVAKYPNGTPAVSEGKLGKGFIILTGIHAEAPASWRRGMKFDSSVSDDNAYALMLVTDALHSVSLPHY